MSLSGMIIKNVVVLLDQVNINLEQGMSPYEAVVESAVSRLRPVVNATATTVLGNFSDVLDGSDVVTIGIPPTRPETGYGYLEVARAEEGAGPLSGVRFVEKPDLPTAEKYLAGGLHFWNSGIFVWDSEAFAAALAQHLVLTVKTLDNMVKGGRASFLKAWLGNVLGQRPLISFVDGALKAVDRYSTRDERCEVIAEALDIDRKNVRVICEHMGGGFGSKLGPSATGSAFAMAACKLAKKAGAPVKLNGTLAAGRSVSDIYLTPDGNGLIYRGRHDGVDTDEYLAIAAAELRQ